MDISVEDIKRQVFRLRGRTDKFKASLTIETSLVLPIFVLCIITFLYFLQIITVQEHIQQAITSTGLSMAKTAYVYGDFIDAAEVEGFDQSILGEEFDISLQEMAKASLAGNVMKQVVKKELNIYQINNSCIEGGFSGISFYSTKILDENDCIDIIVRYYVRIPVWLFGLEDMRMIQRVRLRGWTGHQVAANYAIVEESSKLDGTRVYVTETGTVYHTKRDCSHLKLSIEEVSGIPNAKRNKNGGKYYACESCGDDSPESPGIYYITDYGNRYHTRGDCSRLKRTIREVLLSEVSGMHACKRCGGK
ncbi:MAG TPA: hypothetical protein VJ888_06665 [Mobilitalea sp.]|nr:hypothetical protein [Mobilitalea sp.]